jgi:hypothetical protein
MAMYDLMRVSNRGHNNNEEAYVTKVSVAKGRKVSNPLKRVIIPVAIKANHDPHGWNGAL